MAEQEKQEPQKQTETQKPKKELDRFKFEIAYLVPILASLIFGLGCAYLLAPQQSNTIPVTPIPENTPGAPWGNALYFVVLVAISATIFYILIKRRSKRIIKALIVTAMTAAALLLSLVYLSAAFAYVSGFDFLLIPLSIIIAVLFDLAVFRFGNISRNICVILVGGALGVFFGKFIPLWSAIAILSFLAVYDIIAVYKGPIGKIAQAQSGGGLDELQGLSFSFRDIQMGLGDLVFYSMLTGASILQLHLRIHFSMGLLALHCSDNWNPNRFSCHILHVRTQGHFPRFTIPNTVGFGRRINHRLSHPSASIKIEAI